MRLARLPPPAGPAGLVLPADRAGRVHRLAGAGIRSRARCPRQGRDRSFGHGTDVTEEDGSDERNRYEPDDPGPVAVIAARTLVPPPAGACRTCTRHA